MKKLLLALTLSAFMAPAFGQNGDDIEPTCYDKWAKVFEKRGSYDIVDSTYEKVIVAVRSGTEAECYLGKVTVKDGKMGPIAIMFEDGTYTPLKKKFKHKVAITITNGISSPQVTVDDEIVSVLFTMMIKPKPKEFMAAPSPDDFE